MFDVTRIGALLAERKSGYTLPQALYNSPEVFEFDLLAVFGRSWILAGFICELPEPRGYLALTVGRSPVVITRDRDGVLRAFHNSCRHRGAQICADGSGRRSRLACPYHQWVYDLGGRLVHTARMQTSFDPAEHALRPVHVEAVAGAIFVCLAETPPSFDLFRRQLEPLLAHHRLDEAKLAHECTLVEKGNWKLVMENARECYHCAVGHPELARTFPVEVGEHFEIAGDPHHDAFGARVDALGLGRGPFHGPWWQVERFPLNPGQLSLTMDGKLASRKLMIDAGQGDVGSLRWAVEPHSFCHSTADTTVYFSAMPTAPGETVVTCKWLVHKDAVEGVDYQVDRLTELWNVTNLQDRDLVENNQRGVNSVGYTPGPYCESSEALVMRLIDWYCDKARSFIAERTGADPRRIEVPGTPLEAAPRRPALPVEPPMAALGPDPS